MPDSSWIMALDDSIGLGVTMDELWMLEGVFSFMANGEHAPGAGGYQDYDEFK